MSDDFFEKYYSQKARAARQKQEAEYPELVRRHNRCIDAFPSVIRYILDSNRKCPPKKFRWVTFGGKAHIGWYLFGIHHDGDHNWEATLLSTGEMVQHDDYAYPEKPFSKLHLSRISLQDGKDVLREYMWLDEKFKSLLSNPPVEDVATFRERFKTYAPSYKEEQPRPAPQATPPDPLQQARKQQRQQAEEFARRNEQIIREAYADRRARCSIPIKLSMFNRRYPGITEGDPLVEVLYKALQARIGYKFSVDYARTNERYLWITFSAGDTQANERKAQNDARVRRYLDSGNSHQPAPPAPPRRRTLGEVISDFLNK